MPKDSTDDKVTGTSTEVQPGTGTEPGTGTGTEPQVQPGAPSGEADDNQPVTLAEARRLRRENQNLRKENKDAIAEAIAEAAAEAARQAREEALNEFKAEFGKTVSQAFGINLPQEEEPDPVQLVEQATSKASEAEKRAQAAEQRALERDRELAIFRLAGEADPRELLDSRSFLNSIRDIDPNAADADELIGAAIDRAVEANPRLRKATAAPPRSSGDGAGGNGDPNAGGPEASDIDALRKLRSERRSRNR
ncbi:hypothetical protein [Rhodococcus rhodochrous]|uniref:hypothetical protein n=1 Tax=Rhodococcus rhodochrous TaxID=1829 RepID=UPI00178557F3|nr:hypothetical protein [Rhodococcus rhodochrous]QOH59895.1 hypothetical protein C6Y44_27785 [Rhodococcus rhodochrous]